MANQFDTRRNELINNLIGVYRIAEPSDIALGSQWYPLARSIVVEWSAHYRQDIRTVACAVAAISPQIDWERNLITADDVLADRAVSVGGALRTNIAKARAIVRDRATHIAPYFKSAPKVASFAENLAGSDDYVTVDGHAIQAALNDVRSRVALKWNAYTTFAACYAVAAARTGHSPAEFQAIVWHTWKRLYPRVAKIQARTQWSAMGEY